MKYKIYLDKLEEESNKLINLSKNDIATNVKELDELFNGVKWTGKGYNTFINGYKARMNRLKKYNDNLTKIALYLKDGFNNYNETNDKLVKSWDNFIDEIKGDNDELQ